MSKQVGGPEGATSSRRATSSSSDALRVRVLWLRRDLRLGDHPALHAALGTLGHAVDGAGPTDAAGSAEVLPLFVLDPALWEPAGDVRRARLLDALAAFDRSTGGRLHVRVGDPVDVVPDVARSVGAEEVHVSADFGPYGSRRDDAVAVALAASGAALVRTGSPYAVAPGRVRKGDGTPYRVYTSFARAWAAHGWRAPLPPPRRPRWAQLPGSAALPDRPDLGRVELPPAGEDAALARWDEFRAGALDRYDVERDRADLAGTSGLSAALRWGELHPRTLLAELGTSPAHERFRAELAWREFYADVLHHAPGSARAPLGRVPVALAALARAPGPDADALFAAWCEGRTGYPFVDAGMRQLLGEGWMHNRVRMVTASFLVKDLHLDWRLGARWFMRQLRDGDLASNQHGWQWVAGTGTDAAPYFRVLNPVTQGLRFDPDGDYVRRWVPELRHLPGAAAHEPWKTAPASSDPAVGYPARLVDHATESARLRSGTAT